MKKIVITNGWSDLNAGDSAIIMGIIKRLEMEFDNDMEITILSELHKKNEFFNNSLEKIKEIFPKKNINLISSIFYKKYDDKLLNRVKEIFSLFSSLFKLNMLNFFNEEYYNAIVNADIIISKGGHFIYDRKGINGIIHLYKCLYPLILAEKESKEYVFLGQSFGPFYNNSLLSKFNFKLVKKYMEKAKAISVREEVSYKALKNMNINNPSIFQTSDYGFLINDIDYDLEQIKVPKNKYLILTLRQHDFGKNDGVHEYLITLKKLCDYLYDKFNIKTVVVPHAKGPNNFEDDKIITKKFEELLSKSEEKRFIFNFNYMNAKELVKFYSNAEILIGTRFHSVIFGLCQCVPSIAISYSGYKANIMKQFDMEDFIIDIESIRKENYKVLKEMAEEIINNKKYYSGAIKEKLKVIHKNILNDKAFKKC